MTAPERITAWAELADKATEPLPDDARMDAYYYGFDHTECGPVDAVLSAVAVAGKGAHDTNQWGENDEYGYYADRPGLHPNRATPTGGPPTAISLIQQTAQDSAERIVALATAVPAMAAALTAVLGHHRPTGHGVHCLRCWDSEGQPIEWPCPTVTTIETALGATA